MTISGPFSLVYISIRYRGFRQSKHRNSTRMPITPLVAPVSFRFQNFFVTCWNFGPSLQGLSLTLKGFIRFLKGCFFRKYRKKALLIGIINTGDSKDLLELEGPHHDVLALQELIIRKSCLPFH